MGKLKNIILNIVCIAFCLAYFINLDDSKLSFNNENIEIALFYIAITLIVIIVGCIKEKEKISNMLAGLFCDLYDWWQLVKTIIPIVIIIVIILDFWLG